jgi:predicted DNA binding CopG/RHH family protein
MSGPVEDRVQPADDLDAVQNRARLYGMAETKLTIRIDRITLERAKRYAQQHGTSLTRLVTSHLERLGAGDEHLGDAPVTRRLTGVLPHEASLQDYRDHLERKHA